MTDKSLYFYEMMQYPIPSDSTYFIYKTKVSNQIQKIHKKQEYSPAMQKHLQTINKYNRLRKNLPFIKAIYICDSISFNAATEKSDIDLFFVVKHKSIRRTRFFSVLIFRLLGRKRSLKKKAGFFDLIFYVDEKKSNLEHLALKGEDVYLSYWVAHLVPVYEESWNTYNIYTYNTRIHKTLPNFPNKHIISLPITTSQGRGRVKKIIENIIGIGPDNFWEYLIKSIWKPIVITKKSKHGEDGRGVVITDYMLKFHKDKRKTIQKKREESKY